MRGLALILAALAFPAVAADLSATPATPLPKAACGDTLRLAGGLYPALAIHNRPCAAAPVTLIAADPANPPVFPSVVIKTSIGWTLDGLTVDFKPDAATVGWSPGVSIEAASAITLTRMRVLGGPAIAGVAEDALARDSRDAIIGRPVGYGVRIVSAKDVAFTDSEVSGFDRQLNLSSVERVTVARNWLHDRRRTGLVGADWIDVAILDNTFETARPWRVGQTPAGDHSDCLALWSSATAGGKRVRIEGNTCRQLQDGSTLGMWIQGTPAAPYTDVTFKGNHLEIANLQGIALWGVTGAEISGNDLVTVQAQGVEVAKQRPTVLLLDNVSGVTVTRNRLGAAPADRTGRNSVFGNTLMLVGAIAPAGAVQTVSVADPAAKALADQLAAKIAAAQAALR